MGEGNVGFDAVAIDRAYRRKSEAIGLNLYTGPAVQVEVDVRRSKELGGIIEDLLDTPKRAFYESMLGSHTKRIVQAHNGFKFYKKGGDNCHAAFGNMRDAVDAAFDIRYWFDQEFNEYIIDYMSAFLMLRETGQIGAEITKQSSGEAVNKTHKAVERLVSRIQSFKDEQGSSLPTRKKHQKERYEHHREIVEGKLEELYGEPRIYTKTVIAPGNLDYTIDREYYDGAYHREENKGGSSTTALERAMDKKSPLFAEKGDRIMVISTDPIEIPDHVAANDLGSIPVVQGDFYCAQVFGKRHLTHPTLHDRVGSESNVVVKREQYLEEIRGQTEWLRTLERVGGRDARPKLATDLLEAENFYRIDSATTATLFVLGVMDRFKTVNELYSRTLTEGLSTVGGELEAVDYLTMPALDEVLTGFPGKLEEERQRMIVTSLLYNLGGALSRSFSTAHMHPSRLLTSEDNERRVRRETGYAVLFADAYPELKKLGVPQLLSFKTEKLTRIRHDHAAEDAMQTMILSAAHRIIGHHTRYRPYRNPLSVEQAVEAFRKEHPDLFEEGRHRNRQLAIVEHAVLEELGKPELIFR